MLSGTGKGKMEKATAYSQCQSETMAWLGTNSFQSMISSQIWHNPEVTRGAEIYQYKLLPFFITSLGNNYDIVERISIRSLDLVLVRHFRRCMALCLVHSKCLTMKI